MFLFILLICVNAHDVQQTNKLEYAIQNIHTMVNNNLYGLMATDYYNIPFASIEDYGNNNRILDFLLVTSSPTTINLKNNHRGSFSLFATNCSIDNYSGMGFDQMACSRVTFVGEFYEVIHRPTKKDIEHITVKHPSMNFWLDYPGHQYELWTMKINFIYYVGGYGHLHYIGEIKTKDYFN